MPCLLRQEAERPLPFTLSLSSSKDRRADGPLAELRLRHRFQVAVQAADIAGQLLEFLVGELLGDAGHHAIGAADLGVLVDLV
ncbi:hypothetical protein D3C85_1713100 [compost metagenome]